MAVEVEVTEYGLQLGDTVVLLGGLAMPKMEVDVDGLKKMIDEITDGFPARQILGVCVGGVFQKAGWLVDAAL